MLTENKINNKVVIDAKGKTVGRLASGISMVLQGKDRAEYKRNIDQSPLVEVNNCSKIKIRVNKLEQKEYKRFSGYPGGLKTLKMRELIEKKGRSEVLRKAIYGMLPGNKLRARLMKKLILNE